MIFRRRAKDERSASRGSHGEPLETDAGPGVDQVSEFDELEVERPNGPWDRSETDADVDGEGFLDLGGLVVKGGPGLELRLQVDDQTQAVAAVMLAGPESGLELRAFAAPRHDGIWDEVRADIAAEAAKVGGTATELDGEFGTELRIVVPVQTPDGKKATQTSRIVGVDGPRWLLRGTFLGKSAVEPDPEGVVEQAFRDVIVVRGEEPMAPRDMIVMTMPEQAVVEADDEAEGDDEES